jgi:large subunit ribosomal protein L5
MKLSEKVTKEIMPKLAKQYGAPILALPRLEKVTVNTGIGRIKDSKDEMQAVKDELTQITGQKPKETIAKKSIAGFKLRQGQIVGYAVTLRGKRMFDFIERLANVVLPRFRDFEGLDEKKFDKNNNMTISLREQNMFPEVKSDDVKGLWGMSITLTIKNGINRDQVMEYLKEIGFVFEKEQ